MKRVATVAVFVACAPITRALQTNAPFPQSPRDPYANQWHNRRGPTRMHYLDEGYFPQEPNIFDHGSSVDKSEEVHVETPGGVRRIIHTRVETDVTKSFSFYNNYDLGLAHGRSVAADDVTSQRRRRTRLAPRAAWGSAILPTRRRKESSQNLLTFEDEKEIAYNIKSFRSVLRVRDQLVDWMSKEVQKVGIRQLSEPSEAQWASACSLTVEQLNDIMNKGQESRTKLITGNVGLVTLIAKRYYNMLRSGGAGQPNGAGVSGTDATLKLEDLIQEGYMGIMEAAERYDPSKGFRFSTYGTHWIRQRIVRAIAESSRMIRLPVHVQATIRNINKKHEEFEATIGRSPSLPELAHEMGVSLDKLHLYQHLSRNVISLERAVDQHSPEDNRTLGDRIACTELPTPDEDAMSEALRGEVHSMLDALRDNERIVLTHRFGLDDGRPKTLKETAYGMGISIDSVRAVEAKALNRLRQPQLNYRVKDYVKGVGENGIDVENHCAVTNMNTMPVEEDIVHFDQTMTRANHAIEENDDDLWENERPTPESIWSF
mmetsp:Transcript_20241/g.43657  ORF Transcript_20241/g.43657 Transcript_20241/m.43657 type:complete len:545 (-) Transcript_20241:4001-5635(-)